MDYAEPGLSNVDILSLQSTHREGKKLILDIDYTLFDHRSPAGNPLELMRPYLHEVLTAAYAEYDIMIWFATRPGKEFLICWGNSDLLQVRDKLEQLLDDDDDMADFYLTRKLYPSSPGSETGVLNGISSFTIVQGNSVWHTFQQK
ncbi:Ubiquitin-like domain-containing CTD phosphatase-like protein [Drosera capensis]